MSKQERVVCAAVRTNEHGTKIRLYVEYPGHIKQDKQIYGVFGECSHERGFITNKNRFVDPQEAAHIALDNDQVDDVNKLWNVFTKQKNEKDRNRMQEIIYEKTTLMLRSGLKPEDLY